MNPLAATFLMIAALIEKGAELGIGYGILVYGKSFLQAGYPKAIPFLFFAHN
jgi:hypothetical protein